MDLALFCGWEDAKVWAHWNHSFGVHLSSLGPVSCAFPSLRGHHWGWLQGLRAWQWAGQPDCLHPNGSDWWLDGRSILCLLIRRQHFSFTEIAELRFKPRTPNSRGCVLNPPTLHRPSHSPVVMSSPHFPVDKGWPSPRRAAAGEGCTTGRRARWPCHLRAVWSPVSGFTSRSLSPLICRMGTISWSDGEDVTRDLMLRRCAHCALSSPLRGSHTILTAPWEKQGPGVPGKLKERLQLLATSRPLDLETRAGVSFLFFPHRADHMTHGLSLSLTHTHTHTHAHTLGMHSINICLKTVNGKKRNKSSTI